MVSMGTAKDREPRGDVLAIARRVLEVSRMSTGELRAELERLTGEPSRSWNKPYLQRKVAGLGQSLRVADRDVLHAAVAVVDESVAVNGSGPERLLQRVEGEVAAQRTRRPPADDAAREHVDDERDRATVQRATSRFSNFTRCRQTLRTP